MFVARARGGAALLTIIALLLVTSCTSDGETDTEVATNELAEDDEEDEPPPPAGLRVAVVLPDPGAVDAAVLAQMASDVRRLDATRGPGVAEVRPVEPSGDAFRADHAWTLAERDTDLICVVGRANRSLVTELAETYPHLRFCAAPMPANAELPDPVQLLELRSEELGHVVGAAASGAAAGEPIGVVLGTEAQQRGAFRDGLIAAVGDAEVFHATVDEDVDAVAAVEQVLADGVQVVVIDSLAGAAEAVELAAEHALVLTPDAFVRGEVVDRNVLSWRVHWDAVLRGALDRLKRETDAAVMSYGFAEGAFTVSVGDAASASLRTRIRQAVEALEEQEADPLEPADRPAPPEEPGSEDDRDDSPDDAEAPATGDEDDA